MNSLKVLSLSLTLLCIVLEGVWESADDDIGTVCAYILLYVLCFVSFFIMKGAGHVECDRYSAPVTL